MYPEKYLIKNLLPLNPVIGSKENKTEPDRITGYEGCL
jgi:hypothetical protein